MSVGNGDGYPYFELLLIFTIPFHNKIRASNLAVDEFQLGKLFESPSTMLDRDVFPTLQVSQAHIKPRISQMLQHRSIDPFGTT